ncbi:MAG: hypothetical protein COT34_00525 [Candidatus Nealsonbacteria bacterium CG08_land_8_20_14_0_20_43_11]|uniref:histidine kinase n=1 Tax=Candidatus Nealsonbacteria bacterium CG08_land_8_20_14_0_20_43_11 TaxID=1974706 RepID=A0A2M6T1B4_9BACT|nr:MAG: hypothetical protein COT34_00525 [Candidatus Nealsonbacteria bacterium CG08_land_8_20_14_0_20_43_11]
MSRRLSKPKIAEVVSITTHQLKTPISIVKGYLEALVSGDCGEVNEKQKDYLEDALKNLTRMSLIVNHLLEVSRIEEGRYKLQKEKFSLEKITTEVIQDLLSWVRASNSEIYFKSEPNLPPAVSDSLKIRQVIENIISNAFKYKNPGKGKIEIRIKKQDKYLVFSCKDNGTGIPKEDLKKIFSKFYRSEKAIVLDPSGTGLGLYINRAIIELSGGKIWCRNNPKRGVTFYFTLPFVK